MRLEGRELGVLAMPAMPVMGGDEGSTGSTGVTTGAEGRAGLEAMEEASSLFRKGLIYKIMVSLYRQYSDTICCI